MTTPKKPEYMFPNLQGLPDEFRRLAAEAENYADDDSKPARFRRVALGEQKAFTQAAQMLEEKLNGDGLK